MRKLLFLASEDWFFARHFLPMARAARASGFDVSVAIRVGDHAKDIEAEGFQIISLDFTRQHFQSFVPFEAIKQLYQVIRKEEPDAVHCIGLPLVVLGGIAARLAGVKTLVLAPTGLGHYWTEASPRAAIYRGMIRLLVGPVLNSSSTHYIFENHEDYREFWLSPNRSNVTFVGGAGTDPSVFSYTAEPAAPPVKVAVVSRMLRTKGIDESIEAVRLANAQGANLELHLFGEPDLANPASLSTDELQQLSGSEGIWWHGHSLDVPSVWRDHHIALLMSHREGLPNSLVEAAASGRPIVTCDVVGCREVIRDSIEGFLVPKGGVARAAARLRELAHDASLRKRMGEAAYSRFLQQFTSERVEQIVKSLYARL